MVVLNGYKGHLSYRILFLLSQGKLGLNGLRFCEALPVEWAARRVFYKTGSEKSTRPPKPWPKLPSVEAVERCGDNYCALIGVLNTSIGEDVRFAVRVLLAYHKSLSHTPHKQTRCMPLSLIPSIIDWHLSDIDGVAEDLNDPRATITDVKRLHTRLAVPSSKTQHPRLQLLFYDKCEAHRGRLPEDFFSTFFAEDGSVLPCACFWSQRTRDLLDEHLYCQQSTPAVGEPPPDGDSSGNPKQRGGTRKDDLTTAPLPYRSVALWQDKSYQKDKVEFMAAYNAILEKGLAELKAVDASFTDMCVAALSQRGCLKTQVCKYEASHSIKVKNKQLLACPSLLALIFGHYGGTKFESCLKWEHAKIDAKVTALLQSADPAQRPTAAQALPKPRGAPAFQLNPALSNAYPALSPSEKPTTFNASRSQTCSVTHESPHFNTIGEMKVIGSATHSLFLAEAMQEPALAMHVLSLDGGEYFNLYDPGNPKARACVTISGAGTFRTPGGPLTLDADRRADGRLWKAHRTEPSAVNSWELTASLRNLSPDDASILQYECDFAQSVLAESQPSTSYGLACARHHSVDHAWVVCIEDPCDDLPWSFDVAVPPNLVRGDGSFVNAPVVFQYMSPHHAEAAVILGISYGEHTFTNGSFRPSDDSSYTSFHENMDCIDPATWKGMWSDDFLKLSRSLNRRGIQVRKFVSKSMPETLDPTFDSSHLPPSLAHRTMCAGVVADAKDVADPLLQPRGQQAPRHPALPTMPASWSPPPKLDVSFNDACFMTARGADAVRAHRSSVATSTDTPTLPWLEACAVLYLNMVCWINRMKLPSTRRFAVLEHFSRGHHPFSSSAAFDPTVLHSHFDKVDASTYERLSCAMRDGVNLGIPQPHSSIHAKPTKAALDNAATALNKLAGYVLKGICHVLPLSALDAYDDWCFRECPCHFVVDPSGSGRLVVNLSAPSDLSEPDNPKSANDLSSAAPSSAAFADPLCNMIDDFLPQLVELLRACGASNRKLKAIKADIRRAHVRVPIHPDSIGQVVVRLQGFMFIFRCTPFGWAFSSHTWTPFATAIQQQVSSGLEAISRSMCSTTLTTLQAHNLLASSFLMYAFCDDFMGVCGAPDASLLLYSDKLFMYGQLLLGQGCFNDEKALEEGFWSYVQRYTGVIFDFQLATASFDAERYSKLKNLILQVKAISVVDFIPLQLAEKIMGVLTWMVRVLRSWQPLSAGFRRCLQGVQSSAAPDTPTSPAFNEAHAAGMSKLHGDCLTLIDLCDYTIDNPESGIIPLARLVPSHQRIDDNTDASVIHCGGDACDTGISVLNISHRQMLLLACGPNFQAALRRSRVSGSDCSKAAVAERIDITIAITEFVCIVAFLLQWPHHVAAGKIAVVLWFSDNANAVSWATKMFAGNPIAQALCRLLGALCHALGVHVDPSYVSTLANTTADKSSRIFSTEGLIDPKPMQDFADFNAALEFPYMVVQPNAGVLLLLDWLESISHIFAAVRPLPSLSVLLPGAADDFCLPADVIFDDRPTVDARFESIINDTAVNDTTATVTLPLPKGASAEVRALRHTLTNSLSWSLATEICADPPATCWTFGTIGCGVCLTTFQAILASWLRRISSDSPLLLPVWCFDTDVFARSVASHLTDTVCFGDYQDADPRRLRPPNIVVLTTNCEDLAAAGSKLGEHGPTGRDFVRCPAWAAQTGADIIIGETSAHASCIHDGAEVEKVRTTLESAGFVPHFSTQQSRFRGDGSSRNRLIFCAKRRSLPFASDPPCWPEPVPEHADHCCSLLDILLPDAEVPSEVWYACDLQPSSVMKDPKPGRLHRVFVLGSGMGSPPGNIVYSPLGVAWCQTRRNGGGAVTDIAWASAYMLWLGSDRSSPPPRVTRYRGLLNEELVRVGLVPSGLLESIPPHLVPSYTAQGTPGGLGHAIFTMAINELRKNKVSPQQRYVPCAHGDLVTDRIWRIKAGEADSLVPSSGAPPLLERRSPSRASKPRRGAFRPSRDQVAVLRARVPNRDWSVPLYPRVTTAERRAAYPTGPITAAEWVQMDVAGDAMCASEIAPGTAARYNSYVNEFKIFLNRYPASARHRLVFPLLHPRVFSPTETEAVLMDYIRWEVGVKGNGHSTCKGKLSGIRYFSVKNGIGDVTKGHLRLDYMMRGLKKLRGAPRKKIGVTRAMLLCMRSLLDLTDPDDFIMWVCCLFAFHFGCRSAEYCAKLAQGKFALDEVVLMNNVSFFVNGVRIVSDFRRADEIRVVFGATKTGGGECRSVFAAGGPLCLVTVLADMLEFEERTSSPAPLFSWFRGSTRAGDGVRYFDVMKLVKAAAVQLGEPPEAYGSHSFRRGFATCYLAAGMPYEWVRMHARWRSDCAREYISLMGDETREFIRTVVSGRRLQQPQVPAANPQVSRPSRTRSAWELGGIRFASCR